MSHANNGIEQSKHLEVHREDLQEAEASMYAHGPKQHRLATKPGEERRVTEKQLGEAAATGSTEGLSPDTGTGSLPLTLHADIEFHTFQDQCVVWTLRLPQWQCHNGANDCRRWKGICYV